MYCKYSFTICIYNPEQNTPLHHWRRIRLSKLYFEHTQKWKLKAVSYINKKKKKKIIAISQWMSRELLMEE